MEPIDGVNRSSGVAGRTDQARAVYQTLRLPPAAGDTGTRTLGGLLPVVVLSTAFGDRERAQAVYGLLRPRPPRPGWGS